MHEAICDIFIPSRIERLLPCDDSLKEKMSSRYEIPLALLFVITISKIFWNAIDL